MKKIISLLIIVSFINLLNAQREFIYTEYGNKVYFSVVDSLKVINIKSSSISDSSKIKNSLIVSYNSVKELAPNLYLVNTKNKKIDTSTNIVRDTFESVVLLSLDSIIMWTSNRIIVKTKNISIDELLYDYRISYNNYEQFGYDKNTYLIELPESDDLSIYYSKVLYESGKVVFAEPDFGEMLEVNNALYSDQWGLNNTGQYGGTEGLDINVNNAWNIFSGENVKVAVIDEGIDLIHPDLINNLLPGYDATDGLLGGTNGSCKGNDAHGTCCAGIIGAVDNSIGIKGIAYNSKIIPIRIGYHPTLNAYDSKWISYYTWIADGIYKAWSVYGADILTNSWSGNTGDGNFDTVECQTS